MRRLFEGGVLSNKYISYELTLRSMFGNGRHRQSAVNETRKVSAVIQIKLHAWMLNSILANACSVSHRMKDKTDQTRPNCLTHARDFWQTWRNYVKSRHGMVPAWLQCNTVYDAVSSLKSKPSRTSGISPVYQPASLWRETQGLECTADYSTTWMHFSQREFQCSGYSVVE